MCSPMLFGQEYYSSKCVSIVYLKKIVLQIIAKLKNRMLLFFKVWRKTICAGLFLSKLHLTANSDNEIEHVKKAFSLYCKAYVYEVN